MYRVFRLYPILCLLIIAGCAQVRSISGGEKDTTPPVLIGTYPESNSIRFSQRSFTLEFDEFVQLREVQKELLVSPPLKTPPRTKIRQKSIEVSWSDTLAEETTYIFQFGKSVADVNESNVLSDLTYVFSTGDKLDSLTCSGIVVDAFSDKPASAIKVFLFDSLSHVFDAKKSPSYFTRTAENGRFSLGYLRKGNFVLCALSDENGNNHYDIGESIAWKDSVETRLLTDSVNDRLLLSIPRDTLVQTFDYLTDSAGVLRFHIKPWMDTPSVRAVNGDEVIQWTQSDTLYATSLKNCSTRFEVQVVMNERVLDTLTIEPKRDALSPLKLISHNGQKMVRGEVLIIQGERPIVGIDDSRLKCYRDSVEVACGSSEMSSAFRSVQLEIQPGSKHRVLALPGWATDDCGRQNDTLEFSFVSYDTKELGSVRFKLPPAVVSASHTFQLLDRTKRVVHAIRKLSSTDFTIEGLVPGDYTAVICNDRDSNGVFDPLVIRPVVQTERNHVYPSTIQIRANWEVVVDWPSLLDE